VNFCYGMLHYLCSGLVVVIVIAQAQHINSRKYTSSYTVMVNVDRQLSIYILQCKQNEISYPHVN
jgi:sulfite exporter TauE/SafE